MGSTRVFDFKGSGLLDLYPLVVQTDIAELEIRFVDDDLNVGPHALAFKRSADFRYISFESCSAEHVEAYDAVNVVEPSEWLNGRPGRPYGLQHFRMFFDDYGCIEVLAVEFAVVSAP